MQRLAIGLAWTLTAWATAGIVSIGSAAESRAITADDLGGVNAATDVDTEAEDSVIEASGFAYNLCEKRGCKSQLVHTHIGWHVEGERARVRSIYTPRYGFGPFEQILGLTEDHLYSGIGEVLIDGTGESLTVSAVRQDERRSHPPEPRSTVALEQGRVRAADLDEQLVVPLVATLRTWYEAREPNRRDDDPPRALMTIDGDVPCITARQVLQSVGESGYVLQELVFPLAEGGYHVLQTTPPEGDAPELTASITSSGFELGGAAAASADGDLGGEIAALDAPCSSSDCLDWETLAQRLGSIKDAHPDATVILLDADDELPFSVVSRFAEGAYSDGKRQLFPSTIFAP